jgi:hypothetical protein
MPRQIIEKDDPNTFTCYWVDDRGTPLPGSKIILDFRPVIEAARVAKDFVIVHYQARPSFLRRFGVLYRGDYFSVNQIEAATPYRTVWVHETNLLYPPNAVIVHPESRVVVWEDLALISPAR